MKNILIVGGGGFLGKHLAGTFAGERDFSIFILDRINCDVICSKKTFAGDVSDFLFLSAWSTREP